MHEPKHSAPLITMCVIHVVLFFLWLYGHWPRWKMIVSGMQLFPKGETAHAGPYESIDKDNHTLNSNYLGLRSTQGTSVYL